MTPPLAVSCLQNYMPKLSITQKVFDKKKKPFQNLEITCRPSNGTEANTAAMSLLPFQALFYIPLSPSSEACLKILFHFPAKKGERKSFKTYDLHQSILPSHFLSRALISSPGFLA